MPASESDQPPGAADQALILAFLAFGQGHGDPAWGRLSDSWRRTLQAHLPDVAGRLDPPSACARLASDHAAEARPDPARIHPSWWARALKREARSVRWAVMNHAPEPVGPALRRAFGDDLGIEVAATYPPDPDALDWVVTLAGERFVGGPSRRDDDPPIVRAIAALNTREYARLLTALGLAKLAFAEQDEAARTRDRDRIAALRPSLPEPRPALVNLAVAESAALRHEAGDSPLTNLAARLGLRSLGRLLAAVEPHRARWALQHLPYQVARSLGPLMNLDDPSLAPADLIAWESALLRAAIILLVREGRIDPLILAEPS